MCFILTSIKIKEDEQARGAIVEVLEDAQKSNSHGTGSVCFNEKKDNVFSIRRERTASIQEMFGDVSMYDVVNYHFRMATQGNKTEENVHFWKRGNWVFAHNGQVFGMGNDRKSDSRVFFNSLIRKKYVMTNGVVKFDKIQEYMYSGGFWGRFILINVKSKKMYFFGDFHFYLLNRAYMVITSAFADFESRLNVYGIEWELENGLEVLEKTMDGVYVLDVAKKEFRQISEGYHKPLSSHYGYEAYTPSKPTTGQTGFASLTAPKEKKEDKPRTAGSYVKEFYGRLKNVMQNEPIVEENIYSEAQQSAYNEMGLTPTEMYFWQKWIVPKLPDSSDEFTAEVFKKAFQANG